MCHVFWLMNHFAGCEGISPYGSTREKAFYLTCIKLKIRFPELVMFIDYRESYWFLLKCLSPVVHL